MRTLDPSFAPEVEVRAAHALPLGATPHEGGVGFAVASAGAPAMTLVLFAPGASAPTWRVPLDPRMHRDGDVWRVWVGGLPRGCEYLWEVRDRVPRLLLDPYATTLTGREEWNRRRRHDPMRVDVWGYRCRVPSPEPAFAWGDDAPPRTPLEQSVIYELHVRSFTRHASSGVAAPGTYAALVEKIPYLRALGVTAVELLPVHEFNETENLRADPTTHRRLVNLWGYSTAGYFAPKASYAAQPDHARDEFRQMVRAFHAAGLEVILDVVFNHTAEGPAGGPLLHFRGFDDAVYYIHDPATGRYFDSTGCGNTVNANHPRVVELIVASLRYWVREMHVDGFRFDLASSLTRGAGGKPLPSPPLMEAIAADPDLRDVKLIAEAWDLGLYHVGSFPGAGRAWAEWNGRARDTVRRFVRGAEGQVADLRLRLDGSPDLYAARGLSHGCSVNYVACHDGFPLADLVAYDHKHNLRNGEHDRDGENHNESWNCGAEGATDDPAILDLRARQRRNLLALVCLMPGALMLGAGDEMGRTQGGNNNAWCQDNEIAWLEWSAAGEHAPWWRFVRDLLAWRRGEPLLTTAGDARTVQWRDAAGAPLGDDVAARTLVAHLTPNDPTARTQLLVVAHASWEPATVRLPPAAWRRVLDTALPDEDALQADCAGRPCEPAEIEVGPRSIVVLMAEVPGP